MKKSLIAFAALAAAGAVSAQSSVTLYGIVDVAAEATKKDSGKWTKTLSNNRQGTSQISVKGVEELGGGLKGIFLIENDYDPTLSANTEGKSAGGHILGSQGGEVYVGLTGGFGTVKLGSPNTPTLSTQGGRQPFGTKLGGGFGGGGNNVLGSGKVRQEKSIRYDTPSFGGASLALDVADGKAYDLGAFYAAGPLSAGLTYWKQNASKLAELQASYAFGPLKLMGGFHKESGTSAAVNGKGVNVGFDYALTPNLSLLGNVAKLNRDAAGADPTAVAFGPKYSLSKRTSTYARYVQQKDTDGIKTKTMLVGVMHNF